MSVDFAPHLHYNLNRIGDQMEKKAFTLVELIAVVAILGLIALVVYPSVGSVIRNAREETYNDQVSVVINAAKNWSINNATKLSDDGSIYSLSVDTLLEEGYITNDEVKDPRDSSKNLEGIVEIKYNNDTKSYDYTYNDEPSETENIAMNLSDTIIENSKKKAF